MGRSGLRVALAGLVLWLGAAKRKSVCLYLNVTCGAMQDCTVQPVWRSRASDSSARC